MNTDLRERERGSIAQEIHSYLILQAAEMGLANRREEWVRTAQGELSSKGIEKELKRRKGKWKDL